MPDIQVTNHGSIMLFQPMSELGQSWLDEHLDGSDVQYWGNAVVVEPRYARGLADAMLDDGLEVR